MRNLKIDVTHENGYSPLNAEYNMGVTNDVIFAYVHTKMKVLLSGLIIFYDFNLNKQIYLEFVKYQLGLHRNVQVFAKCNVCISVVLLFYIQTCQDFLPISK